MSPRLPAARPPLRHRKRLWFERLMAIVALANLGLVVFDLSYIPLRNFWLLGKVKLPLLPTVTLPMPPAPAVCKPLGEIPDKATLFTACYDRVKGIEAYRETQAYLENVNQLEQLIQQEGVRSPAVAQALKTLQEQSTRMINENWFTVANKAGTLEKIKDRMRDRIYVEKATIAASLVSTDPAQRLAFEEATRRRAKRSSQKAFNLFWTADYLAQAGVQQELTWFDDRIRHLIQTNYYRSIEENGEFTNNFWVLDAPFVILFAIEFLARTWYISWQYKSVRWQDAALWRWYDVLLFFPFGLLFYPWAWLRVIPVSIRLHQAHLIDLEELRGQATQGFVGSIAEELTEVVVVQVLNQVQQAVQQGEIMRWLLQPKNNQISVNNVDEITELVSLFIKLTVYQVLPKVQPDLEVLLRHTIESVLNQTPAYQTLKAMPGLSDVPTQLIDRLVSEVLQATYSTLTMALEDPIGTQLTNRLIQNFGQTLGKEVQEQQVTNELKTLVNDFLEELKLNYVKRSAEIDVETLLEETRQLQQSARRQTNL
ncbi:MAG: hypothetical protein KME27_25800 [Lyngbya sp. HA4199-MV5]|jgi:hypothetical protein|nr:hypothetical protein [Lyngbya sp. HA4199-MV5]